MSLISLAINHKLRPTYRRFGHRVGEIIADAVEADPTQREKIIYVSEKAASMGLSLACAVAVADHAGILHALSAETGNAAVSK